MTLQKFQHFLLNKKITIRHIVCEKENILFLIGFNENLHEYMIITLSKNYKMMKKDIDIKVDVISVESYINNSSSVQKEELNKNLDFSVPEIDGNMKDDSQMIKNGLSMSNYKEIVIQKETTDDKFQYNQYSQQLEKFKECVKNIRYKFAIFSQDYITLLDRTNNINNYVIRVKDHYIPITNIVLCICVDIENLFENIDTLVEDSIKLYSSFYTILNDAHKKQIIALDAQIKLIIDVPNQIEQKKNDLSKVQMYLNTTLQNLSKLYKEESKLVKLKEFEERKRAIEQKDTRQKDFSLTKIETELSKILEQKEKQQEILSNIRMTYHQQLLSFDYNVFKGLQLFHSMTENIKKVL